MVWYATLDEARRELVVDAAGEDTTAEEDAYVLQALEWVTQRIDNWPSLGFEFAPRKGVRFLNALGRTTLNSRGPSALTPGYDGRDLTLALNHPLLEASLIEDGGGHELTLWDGSREQRAASDCYLYPRGKAPCWTLRMLPESTHAWSEYVGDPVEAIRVEGTWGYHSAYADAWQPTGKTLVDDPLPALATVLHVADAAGLAVGQLLQIGSEWLLCTSITEGDSDDPAVVGVKRGQRGTVNTEHAQGTPLFVWHVEPMIQRACVLWVAYLYSRRGNYADKKTEGYSTITFPPDAPPEVMAILETFAPKVQTEDSAWGAV